MARVPAPVYPYSGSGYCPAVEVYRGVPIDHYDHPAGGWTYPADGVYTWPAARVRQYAAAAFGRPELASGVGHGRAGTLAAARADIDAELARLGYPAGESVSLAWVDGPERERLIRTHGHYPLTYLPPVPA